ncbi:MAG TPA: azurin [Dokdonella sp.]|uniref:azurin n=1 Tax=Dokdonella sp. TaxID=2291710 RepID=UPI0025BF00A7|nr:azurin [Dokdonella sp.]MBX3693067.1 azurin [Dokdonella sp.]HNR91568.1 azurin [Dokdonella sp.]
MIRRLALASALLFASSSAFAACSVDIEGNDAMQFNLKTIEVDKSCKDFTVNLKHVGKLAKNVMGHNWALTASADMQGAATDGQKAGLEADYIKAGDARVIAHTKMIGGGESTSVTFPVSKLAADTPYTFFCSFPGHWGIMKGTLTLK